MKALSIFHQERLSQLKVTLLAQLESETKLVKEGANNNSTHNNSRRIPQISSSLSERAEFYLTLM